MPSPRRGPFHFLVTGKFGRSTQYRLSSSIAGLSVARDGGLDVRLLIAGVLEPTVLAAVTRQIDSLGLANSVELLGSYTGAQAPELYQRGDAYLMTKHNDPCPNAVLEALASGLPVLYSASGGVPELVGGEAGLGLSVRETFDEDVAPEPAEIATGMAKVMEARDNMALAARQRAVERFDIAHWFDRHEAVFTRLLGNS